MKRRLLVLTALLAVVGGAGAFTVAGAHAQAVPAATTQQSAQQDLPEANDKPDAKDTAEPNDKPDAKEAKESGKPDTDNVQQGDQNGPDSASETTETANTQQ